jgi:hypothetical protein
MYSYSPPGTLVVLCQRDLQTAAYPEALKCLTTMHLVHPPLHSLSPCETHVKSMSYSMVSTNMFTSVTSYLSTAEPCAAVVNACSKTYRLPLSKECRAWDLGFTWVCDLVKNREENMMEMRNYSRYYYSHNHHRSPHPRFFCRPLAATVVGWIAAGAAGGGPDFPCVA